MPLWEFKKGSSMEQEKSSIDRLADHIKQYIQTRIDLFELQVKQRLTSLLSGLLLSSMFWIFFLSFLLFINLGLAFFLSDYFKSNAIGFSLVAGFYFVCWLKIKLFRNFYKRMISNFLIKEVFKDDQD